MREAHPLTKRLRRGDRFGLWKVTGTYEVRHSRAGCKQYHYPVVCKCGNTGFVDAWKLILGHSRSCGCFFPKAGRSYFRAAGDDETRIRRIWKLMHRRCSNPSDKSYHRYGGRGITVWPGWKDFEAFRRWALANGYARDLTIERADVDGHYGPDNCSWATIQAQQKNRRTTLVITAFGEAKCLADWTRDPRCKVSAACVKYRIDEGWRPEDAMAMPARPRPAKLRQSDIPTVFELHSLGMSQAMIAARLGVSQPTISGVLKGSRVYEPEPSYAIPRRTNVNTNG